MPTIRAVVFDLDDTLYPERAFVQSGFRAVSSYLREHRIVHNDVYPLLWQKFSDGVRGTIFNEVLCELIGEADDRLIRTLVFIYRTHMPDIRLYPDALPVLYWCTQRYKTGLLSDGSAYMQQNKIIALGIRSFFNAVMLTDTLGREYWKPHVAGYQKLSDALGVPPQACLYVGDNAEKDFIGAKKSGWFTVHVRRPDGIYTLIPESEDKRADVCIESLEKLEKVLI
ncbi:MAG: HAD family hydrolase [Desulfobacterota bacterium]|nr:HAD family hydrolase [Thermodesulfobacteriota bacterium]